MAYTMTINNQKIFEFYARNPNVNFESMNLVLLGFIEHLSQDMSSLMQSTIQGQLMAELKGLRHDLQETLGSKLADANKAFLETMKLVVSANHAEHGDRVAQLLGKHTDAFIDKINVILPKTQDDTYRKMQDQLALVQRTLQCDLQQFMLVKTDHNVGEFIASLDAKLCALQHPLFSLMQSNQECISNKILAVKEDLASNKSATERVFAEMSEFLHKYKASPQFKGQTSENMLHAVLSETFPTASIENTTAHTACGDFMLRRAGAPNILFENKNYERNVEHEEVKKFIRDVEMQRCSGIMLSQASGIVSKPNFFIEINDQHVLVYLHRVQFSREQIKLAVDVIDHLTSRLSAVVATEASEGTLIPKEVLDRINVEVQAFVKNKEVMANTIRETNKRLLAQLEDLHLPELLRLITDKYTSQHAQAYVCETCNQSFNTKRSLAAHRKAHVKK